MPVFVGHRFQRGHGLGSILSGFFRRLVLPFFKTYGKSMLSGALKTGMEVADDVLDGQPLKERTTACLPELEDSAETKVCLLVAKTTAMDTHCMRST